MHLILFLGKVTCSLSSGSELVLEVAVASLVLDLLERSVGQIAIPKTLVHLLLFFSFSISFQPFLGQISMVAGEAGSNHFNAQTFAHELGHNLGMR